MIFSKLIKYILNDISISKKLIISCIFVVFIPVIVVGLILISQMKNIVIDKSINEAITDVCRVKQRVGKIIDTAITVSDKLYNDKKLQKIISKKYISTWDVVKTYKQYKEFDEYESVYAEINDIRIYVPNHTLLEDMNIMKADSSIVNSLWYNNALNKNGSGSWEYIYDDIKKDITYV